MIKQAYGHSGVYVSIGHTYGPYTPIPQSAVPGTVWFNDNNFHVYTGSGWEKISGVDINIGLEPQVQDVISWAKQKMAAEQKEAELLEKYPALKSAKENYDLIKNLVKDNI
jgi:hypothetical protein